MITPDDDIADFRRWLERECTALLPSKSQWEVVRWSDNGETFVMYRNKRGKVSWSSEAAERYWDQFCSEDSPPVKVEKPAWVPAPTEAFVLQPACKIGQYSGADLNTADGRWIASIHETGYDNKVNVDFAAIGKLLAAAPLTLTFLIKAHKALQEAGAAEDLQYLIYKHINQLENP